MLLVKLDQPLAQFRLKRKWNLQYRRKCGQIADRRPLVEKSQHALDVRLCILTQWNNPQHAQRGI